MGMLTNCSSSMWQVCYTVQIKVEDYLLISVNRCKWVIIDREMSVISFTFMQDLVLYIIGTLYC